ncbi:hypothetical protein SBOR_6824 [Sclerotinia borealis F-4128]|uniref:Uncharacterized protein n=1 Tax=Sclerotinia borealis (strain F-4128) TaxID=1432307 RepID=W9C7M4_SCLBF|nr:hypothetical protein SBOR_6824 [Sclerotinia borealis F-4128]
MGQTARENEISLNTSLNASIFIPYPGPPTAPLPTDRDAKIKLLKAHHHKVRGNIVTAFILEKEQLLSKFKDDIAKHKSGIESGRNDNGLKTFRSTDRELSVSVKEDAREKNDEKELEALGWLRGPRWLLLLQSEDVKKGVWELPKEELDRRESRLKKETEGHTGEEYEWKMKDFYNHEQRSTSPQPVGVGESEGERDNEGDIVMGGLDLSNVSPTQLFIPANTRTPFEIQHKFNLDLQKLLETGIKKLKEYNQHTEMVMARYKQDLGAAIIDRLGKDTSGGGTLKSAGQKVQSVPSPSKPIEGILKRKSVSMQSPSDTLSGILKKSATIHIPTEKGGTALKKSVSIQIPPSHQNAISDAPSLIQSPMEMTGSALRKVRLDDHFWNSASPSPSSMNAPSYPQQFQFPTNIPTGLASSDTFKQPSNSSSVPQSPSTPSARTGSRDYQNGKIGKTFVSSSNWYGSGFHNLDIRTHDMIQIIDHIFGDTYEGLNKETQQRGKFNIKYFLGDLDSMMPIDQVGKIFTSSSDYAPKLGSDYCNLEIRSGDKIKIKKYHSKFAYTGLNMTSHKTGIFNLNFYWKDIEVADDINRNSMLSGPKNDSNDDHNSPVGKTLTAIDTWGPKHDKDASNLSIKIGDKITINKYINGITYTGLNERSRKTGQFSMGCFREDIEHPFFVSSPNFIGKTFISSHTPNPQRQRGTTDELEIRAGDEIKIIGPNSENMYGGYNVKTERAGQFNIESFRRDIDPLDNVGKIFTATSSLQTSDLTALRIEIGDNIKILSFMGYGFYNGHNLRSGQTTGRFFIDQFQNDIKAARKPPNDSEYSRTEVEPANKISPPKNGNIEKPGFSFSIKGTAKNLPSGQTDIRRLSNGMPIVTENGENGRGADSIEKLARRGI